MKEKLRQLFGDKRGVSPVIGVVLMVAVVVILAAVIGAFVLGLGGDQSQAPQASFSLDNGDVVYEGGDNISADNIDVLDSDGTSIASGTTSGELTPGNAVAEGVSGSGTVRVVYTGDGGSTTIWQTDTGS